MKNIFFILLLSLFSQIVFANETVVLDAQGYGKTPNEAKQNALQELVFKLKASVDTKLNISTQVTTHNSTESLTENSSSNLNISGKSFFEGIQYSNISKKNTFYQTKALLTKSALKKTLLTLKEDILLPIERLSKKEQKKNLEKVPTFFALYKYKTSDLTELNSNTIEKIKQQQQLLYSSINMAKIIFKTNVSGAKIEIAGKTYTPNKAFYIEHGNYIYTISKNGYIEENGKFFAQAGHSKTIKKELIKANKQKINIYINSSSQYDIKDDVASVLSNYNIQTTSKTYASNAFDFKFSKKLLFKAGSTSFYKFSLTLKAYKNNQVVLTKKATLKRVADSKLASKASKLAKALTKATLKKLNMKKFHSSTKVNYKTLLY